jgi:hypothetical protein
MVRSQIGKHLARNEAGVKVDVLASSTSVNLKVSGLPLGSNSDGARIESPPGILTTA